MSVSLQLRCCYLCFMSLVVILSSASLASAQTDTIHGIINRYTKLVYIECTNNSAIQVENPHGFYAGDKILIIQMQGAVIDKSNTSAFGSITTNNNAGNYEIATIDEIHGYTFILHYELARTYTLSGIIQVIRVPTYANVVVSDTLKAQPWNGSTGGVLALIATGQVVMSADMDVTGCGFREGRTYAKAMLDSVSYAGYKDSIISTSADPPTGFFCAVPSDSGALKGEGIHIAGKTYLGGKGALSNAGGGSNGFLLNTAGGGGGGGNFGNGGNGGGSWTSDSSGLDYAGIGGYPLGYADSLRRIYLGGSGGWGGPDLDNHKGPGRAGGGIVFIRANQMDGNGHRIRAEGADTAMLLNTTLPSYPGGGGGAGGVILLDVTQFTDTVIASVTGGRGQNVDVCDATGGGGGGGCIWLSGSSSTPAYLVTQTAGGAAGVMGGSCGGPTIRDGKPGASGGVLTNLQIPEGNIPR